MKLSPRYGTHLLVLLQAVAKTQGPILELGMGVTSTPILHEISAMEKRLLVSYENNPQVFNWADKFLSEYHLQYYVQNWDDAEIDKEWDVVLVDHSPSERRIVEINRLTNLAKYVILHDSNGRYDKEYHYSKIYPLFKYKYTFDAVEPSTTVLSNFINLDDFWSRTWTRSITF